MNRKTSEESTTEEKKIRCEKCNLKFYTNYQLRIHNQTHTNGKLLGCPEYNADLDKPLDLRLPVWTHTGECRCKRHLYAHVCTLCNATFPLKDNLKEHLKIHGEKPYVCTECNKRFSTPDGLKNHQRTHNGKKPHVCTECGKSFYSFGGLKTHLRIHTKEKPYKCETCKQSFSCPRNLKRHFRMHTGEKPYACKVCNRTFTFLSSLKQHMKIHTK